MSGSRFLDPPLLLMQKGCLIVSGGTVKEHREKICLITNIVSEFLNYVLTIPFIMLNLLGSFDFSFPKMFLFERNLQELYNSHSYFLCSFPDKPIATNQSKSRIRHKFVQKPEGRKRCLR